MALEGFRVMLPRKFFENLDTFMAVLVLFEQVSRQIFFNCFTPTPSPSPTIMYFLPTFSIYGCLRRKDYCYQSGSKLWKNCIHQK